MNNDGLYLWKSDDLEEREPLGRVASLARDNNLGNNSGFHPINYFFPPSDSLEPLYTRGIITPRLYVLKGDCWIAPLTADMKAFAERPRLLEIEDGLYAGKGGCQIFKQDGRYRLLAANAWGDVTEHVADKLQGPYRHARIAFAQAAGKLAVFADPVGGLRAVREGE